MPCTHEAAPGKPRGALPAQRLLAVLSQGPGPNLLQPTSVRTHYPVAGILSLLVPHVPGVGGKGQLKQLLIVLQEGRKYVDFRDQELGTRGRTLLKAGSIPEQICEKK